MSCHRRCVTRSVVKQCKQQGKRIKRNKQLETHSSRPPRAARRTGYAVHARICNVASVTMVSAWLRKCWSRLRSYGSLLCFFGRSLPLDLSSASSLGLLVRMCAQPTRSRGLLHSKSPEFTDFVAVRGTHQHSGVQTGCVSSDGLQQYRESAHARRYVCTCSV